MTSAESPNAEEEKNFMMVILENCKNSSEAQEQLKDHFRERVSMDIWFYRFMDSDLIYNSSICMTGLFNHYLIYTLPTDGEHRDVVPRDYEYRDMAMEKIEKLNVLKTLKSFHVKLMDLVDEYYFIKEKITLSQRKKENAEGKLFEQKLLNRLNEGLFCKSYQRLIATAKGICGDDVEMFRRIKMRMTKFIREIRTQERIEISWDSTELGPEIESVSIDEDDLKFVQETDSFSHAPDKIRDDLSREELEKDAHMKYYLTIQHILLHIGSVSYHYKEIAKAMNGLVEIKHELNKEGTEVSQKIQKIIEAKHKGAKSATLLNKFTKLEASVKENEFNFPEDFE